jgi:hypothetical protein
MMQKHAAAGLRWGHAKTRLAQLLGVLLFLSVFSREAGSRTDRVNLFPKLQTGQIIYYQISYRSSRQTQTQSSIKMAQSPGDVTIDAREQLRMEILGVASQGRRAIIHARAWFQSLDSDAKAKIPASQPQAPAQPQDPNGIAVEFTILPDGRMDQVKGLDALPPEQQQAWQQWASRFAASAVFPPNGIKVAQKWKSEEIEKSPSPIARLTWIRESTYVHDEPCRPVRLNPQGDVQESDQPPETCAVILTTATLKQESSPKDTTPEDFRIRQLRTSGTARGNNKTITYISLKTGLVVRASDEADQAMAVTIAKADGTNHVHYEVHAKSSAEVLLVAEPPPNHP